MGVTWASLVEIFVGVLLLRANISKHLSWEVHASSYVDRVVLHSLVGLLLLDLFCVVDLIPTCKLSAVLSSCALGWWETLTLVDRALARGLVALKLGSWLKILLHDYLSHGPRSQSILLRGSVTLRVRTSSHPVILNYFPGRTTKLLLSEFQLVLRFLNLVFQHSVVDVFQITVFLLPSTSLVIV